MTQLDLRRGRASWRSRADIDIIMWIDRRIASKAMSLFAAEFHASIIPVYQETIAKKNTIIEELMERVAYHITNKVSP